MAGHSDHTKCFPSECILLFYLSHLKICCIPACFCEAYQANCLRCIILLLILQTPVFIATWQASCFQLQQTVCDIHVHGRRPRRGLGGTVPPKFEVGWTAHASVPPIFWEIVFVGCAQKHEQSKKWCHQGIIFWNRGFSREEGSHMTLHAVKIWKIWKKYRKNLKNMVND